MCARLTLKDIFNIKRMKLTRSLASATFTSVIYMGEDCLDILLRLYSKVMVLDNNQYKYEDKSNK